MNEAKATSSAMNSDDSEFYGDEDHKAHLKSKVDNMNIQEAWQEYKVLDTPIKWQAEARGSRPTPTPTPEPRPVSVPQYHNSFADYTYARQVEETVDEFLERLPPITTLETPGHSWIWICNPRIKRKSRNDAQNQHVRGGENEVPESVVADLPTFMQAGQERLGFASEFIDQCQKSGAPWDYVRQECEKAGADAAKDILDLAEEFNVTCGKWMIYCPVHNLDEFWGTIARETANSGLGIAAKVSIRPSYDQSRERQIFVYTADFSHEYDVVRVAKRLKHLGIIGRTPIYYRPDAYTYLGIEGTSTTSNNPWEIRPSIYDSRSLMMKHK